MAAHDEATDETTDASRARREAAERAAQGDEGLRALLEDATCIAVVGIKDRESEDAHRIPKYLQDAGYRIVPVNPKVDQVLGESAYASLADVEETIDIVDLFRASDNIPAHAEQILAMDPLPTAVWMQLGIHHGPSASQLRAAGVAVVEDACIMVEHRRLLGGADG